VGVDLDAVRTFVAVADTGQFSEAAVDLSITQQAVSKRVAALERDLGVRQPAPLAYHAAQPSAHRPSQPARRPHLDTGVGPVINITAADLR
jgi:hypothetical protein